LGCGFFVMQAALEAWAAGERARAADETAKKYAVAKDAIVPDI